MKIILLALFTITLLYSAITMDNHNQLERTKKVADIYQASIVDQIDPAEPKMA